MDGGGGVKDKIIHEIRGKNLEENIRFLGVRSDVERILQVLNVFILPSKFEGLPVAAVEAQAAGVPTLCSENISPEVNISHCCKMLPVDSVMPWVKNILLEQNFRRIENSSDEVIAAGYDVHENAKQLQNFYENIFTAIKT